MGQVQLLTVPEVAERLRVPIETVRWWRKNGEGPKGFKVGRRVVFAADDVDAWIQQRRDTVA